jgi:hypothetical protein
MLTQPQIPARYRLLYAGWPVGRLFLDIYGTSDEDGAQVCAVAQHGQTVDLTAIVCSSYLEQIELALNHLGAQMKRESRAEDIAERAQWARDAA